MELQVKKLRTIPGIIKEIKAIDPGTYVNYRFIETLIETKHIATIKHGNRVLVYLEDILSAIEM